MEYRWQHVVLDGISTPHRLHIPEGTGWQHDINEKARKKYREETRERMALPDGFVPADGADGAWKPIGYSELEEDSGVLWRRLLVSAE
jgi:hypothetical protein